MLFYSNFELDPDSVFFHQNHFLCLCQLNISGRSASTAPRARAATAAKARTRSSSGSSPPKTLPGLPSFSRNQEPSSSIPATGWCSCCGHWVLLRNPDCRVWSWILWSIWHLVGLSMIEWRHSLVWMVIFCSFHLASSHYWHFKNLASLFSWRRTYLRSSKSIIVAEPGAFSRISLLGKY